MDKELISVIIPAYGVESYIDKCLESIVNQTHKELQVIVINDNSPDKTGEIADMWARRDNRIEVIHNISNKGHSLVRNDGLKRAKGEYIGFVDSDDYIHPKMFEFLLATAKKYDCDVSLCHEQAFDEGTKEPMLVLDESTCTHLENHDEYMCHFMDSFTGLIGWSWNKLYKASVLKDIYYRNYMYEDIVFNAEIARHINKAVWIEDRLYAYRIRKDSITAAGQKDISLQAAESFWATYQVLKNEKSEFVDKYLVYTIGKIANLYAHSNKHFGKESADRMHEFFSSMYRENISVIKKASKKDRVKLFMAMYAGPLYSMVAL